MSNVVMEFDGRAVTANLAKVAQALTEGLPKRALGIGFELMRLSQMEVPHDEGTLQNSGVVEEVNGDIVVGYHTPYAARLHEHPEYRFQKGRKGKYLEDPILRNTGALGIQLAKGIQDDINGATK